MSNGNKYTRLISNTVLFGISTFSSKLLSFLLVRLYTGVFTDEVYGVVDLVTTCANLLIPLVSLGISNAVIRFGLEKGVSKPAVFTGGLAAIGCGFGVLLLFAPFISMVNLFQNQVVLLYIYVLASCLRTLCCQFVRAQLYTRLYAVDGILSTLYTLGFNVLYLVVLDLGAPGYLLAIISADLLSALGLFLVAKLHQYVRVKQFDKRLFKAMLLYSLPLVPASMFWWITNSSDRFFISFMLGAAANGLYAAAYKVPYIVSVFSTIFTEAWQLSAVTDGQQEGREKFFSQIFAALSAIVFLIGGVLIWGCQLIMRYLVAPDFFIAWRYIPMLVIATVFSCLVGFLNSVYMVEKKSTLSLVTMMVGAVSNIILNWWLIPLLGANGAGLATFISYLLVFVIRAINTRRFITINLHVWRVICSTVLLLAEAVAILYIPDYWTIICGIIVAILALLNGFPLLKGTKQLVHRWRNRGRIEQ